MAHIKYVRGYVPHARRHAISSAQEVGQATKCAWNSSSQVAVAKKKRSHANHSSKTTWYCANEFVISCIEVAKRF